MGCGVRLPRSKMREHVQESGQDHLLKMCAASLSLTRELSHKVAEKEQQITELHRDMRRMEEQMKEMEGRLKGMVEEGSKKVDSVQHELGKRIGEVEAIVKKN